MSTWYLLEHTVTRPGERKVVTRDKMPAMRAHRYVGSWIEHTSKLIRTNDDPLTIEFEETVYSSNNPGKLFERREHVITLTQATPHRVAQ